MVVDILVDLYALYVKITDSLLRAIVTYIAISALTPHCGRMASLTGKQKHTECDCSK